MTDELRPEVEILDTQGMSSDWFVEDKTPEDKEKTRQVLLNSTLQFRLLKKMLKKKFNEMYVKPTDLDKPNFDQRRLYTDGYLRALQEVYRWLP